MRQLDDNESRRWMLSDQIAFECALAQDESENWQSLRERDEAIAATMPEELFDNDERRFAAKYWLTERMKQAPAIKLAADTVSQSISVSGQLLGAFGVLLGIGMATAALAYTGAAPINVSAFFGVFVLLQALLACLLLLPFLLPKSLKEGLLSSGLFRLTRFVFNFAYARTQSLANRFLLAQQRNEAAEIAGAFRSRALHHQDTLKWLVFSRIQSVALCFNIGALTALLVAVVFSDRAFGWQTTLDVSTETIHVIVRFFASPWAWLYGEGDGYPALADIEGSRIVLKEGIQVLSTESLVAWWQFLALGIVAYGVLPRLLFRILGGFQMRSALKNYDFQSASVQHLFERLYPPSLRFDAEDVDQSAPLESGGDRIAPLREPLASELVFCLVEEELAASLDVAALLSVLRQRWNLPEKHLHALVYKNGSILDAAAKLDPQSQYALIVESWMPPIKELERQIKTLRSAIDARSLIKVVLLGIPDEGRDAISLRPSDRYRSTWNGFIRRMGDPYLILDNPA